MKTLSPMLSLLIVLSNLPALAQHHIVIKGVVTDPNGSVVEGVNISVTNSLTKETQQVVTDAQGQYTLLNLERGRYVLVASARDFQPVSREIDLGQGESVTVDFQLPLQRVEQQIEVSSATRYSQELSQLPVSATVIQRGELLISPGRSVEESLRYVAGVNLQRDNSDVIFPLNPSIAMRGIGVGDTATRSLVLVDGLPINGGFFGNVFWNRAPKYTIDQVEVVRGASSSLFGSFAMGGVVNVLTHVPDKREVHGEVQYGQNNRFQGNLQYGDVVAKEALAFSLNANYYQTDGFFRLPEDQLRPIDERQSAVMKNLQGRMNAKLSNSVQGFLRAGYNDQDRDGGFQLQQTDISVPDVAGGLDFDLGSNGALSTRAFYAREDFNVDNVRVVDDNTTFVSNRHDTDSNDVGISTQWSKAFGTVLSHLSGGVDFRRIDGQNHQDVFNSPNTLDAQIVGAGTQTSVGAFGEMSLRPIDSIEILGSVRFDSFHDSDGRIITDGAAAQFPDRTFNIVSPRLALRYQFLKPLAFRAAYYEGFRAPTLAERYRSFESPTFRGLSNPYLNEEHLRGGEVGLDFRLGIFDGQVNGFYNRLEDFVGSAEVGFVDDKFTVMNTNVARIRSHGLEAIGNMRLTNYLTLSANYTYTDAEVTDGPLIGNELEGAPRNVASFSLNYFAQHRINLSARGRWLDRCFQDITNEAPMDAHFVFDLFASYRVQKHLELLIVAENLFNDQYIADGFGQSLGAPRQISGGVRFSF